MAVACDTPSRRAMSVGRASPSFVGVVLEHGGRLRRPRLLETPGLRLFGRKFRNGRCAALRHRANLPESPAVFKPG